MNSFKSHDRNAIEHLQKDPVMKKLIKTFGILSWNDRGNDVFNGLIRAIINQQLSTKAAATIYRRFLDLFSLGNKSNAFPSATDILATKSDQLRKSGISYTKIAYIHGVCENLETGKLNLKTVIKKSDKEIIEELTKLKGVGIWSAEMILIATLKRPDVFSLGDLGLRTAVAKHYGIDRNNHKKIEEISLQWKPYRSLACRYLWRSLSEK